MNKPTRDKESYIYDIHLAVWNAEDSGTMEWHEIDSVISELYCGWDKNLKGKDYE